MKTENEFDFSEISKILEKDSGHLTFEEINLLSEHLSELIDKLQPSFEHIANVIAKIAEALECAFGPNYNEQIKVLKQLSEELEKCQK